MGHFGAFGPNNNNDGESCDHNESIYGHECQAPTLPRHRLVKELVRGRAQDSRDLVRTRRAYVRPGVFNGRSGEGWWDAD